VGQDPRLSVVARFRIFPVMKVDKLHPPVRGKETEYTVFFFGDNTQYCNLLLKS
jgi:hypothetical protein